MSTARLFHHVVDNNITFCTDYSSSMVFTTSFVEKGTSGISFFAPARTLGQKAHFSLGLRGAEKTVGAVTVHRTSKVS